MASVNIRNVQKHFGGTHVIRGVDIDIADGEFAVLVGPSGCGKSTLLRMIAGLEEIAGGEIAIGGKVVNDMQPKERDIAMVFQNYALYPHMKVRDNMAFSLLLAKRPRAEIDERVDEGRGDPGAGRAARPLPAPALRRPAPARGDGARIVRDPQVFLFDEPLSNLDAKLRVAMRTELKELHQRLKTTSIYVTHDQIEAMTMADQIVVMRDGLVEQRGEPLELYDRPANLFVAGFIGSPAMNFLPGTLRRDARGARVELGRRRSRADPPKVRPAAMDSSVVFGTRPEHLVHWRGEARGCRRTVVVVEPTGADTQVFAKFGDAEVTAVFRERHDFRPGDADSPRARPRSARICSMQSRESRCMNRSRLHNVGGGESHVEVFETGIPEDHRGRRGRRNAGRGQRDVVAGRVRAGEVDAGEGRQAARAALEALRAGRRGHVARRTPRSSPRRPASRCASTARAGRTCGPRRRWRPTWAAAPTSSSPPSRTRTSIRTSWST